MTDGALYWAAALLGALMGAALPDVCVRLVTHLGGCHNGEAPMATQASAPCRYLWRAARACLSGLGLAAISAGLTWRISAGLGGLWMVGVWLVMLYAGTLLASVDLALRRLPTPVIGVAALAVAGLLTGHAVAIGEAQKVISATLAAAAVGSAFLLLAVVGGSGLGLGDVRLAALLGAALGPFGWRAVFVGAVLPYALAAPEALTRLALRGDPDIAFGPYLLAGALASVAVLGP
ncbi:peptidase A24 [Micromonospora tarensis]|nr:peptidase A24 [Micromonospora tarensis]